MAGKLRHGLNCLWPSEIADQFYCEYKVHLKRLHPEVLIKLPSLELGETSHTALVSQAKPITSSEIAQSIRMGKKVAICEWALEGSFDGVPIRGRPDFFSFEGKRALLVLDFKFSGAKEPFPNHKVQAEVYALLTGRMDFSTEELCLGIVMFPSTGFVGSHREAGATKAARLQLLKEDGTLHKISERCEQARRELLAGRTKKTTIESQDWKAFLFRFDARKAARDLAWALEYWLDEREPIPVKRWPRKCFACPLNAVMLCEHAMQKPDPCFEVRRQPDGRVLVCR